MKLGNDGVLEQYSIRTSVTKKQKRNHSHKETFAERDIRTAYKQARQQKLKELKLVSTPIFTQQLRNFQILHQASQSPREGSVIMLPKKLQDARNPQFLRTYVDTKHNKQSSYDNQSYSQREQSPQWKAFSRKNIQQVNARLKSIRNHQYTTHHLDDQWDSNQFDKLKLKVASFTSRAGQEKKDNRSKTERGQKSLQGQSRSVQKNQRSESHNKFMIREKIKQRSKSVMGTDFYTKLKKKSLQNEPHLLATVIRNKSMKGGKQDLYRFVTKIIERSKK